MAEDEYAGYDESDIEVAKRISCAVASYQMGITYQTCWNEYFKQFPEGKSIGNFWLEIAKNIREQITK